MPSSSYMSSLFWLFSLSIRSQLTESEIFAQLWWIVLPTLIPIFISVSVTSLMGIFIFYYIFVASVLCKVFHLFKFYFRYFCAGVRTRGQSDRLSGLREHSGRQGIRTEKPLKPVRYILSWIRNKTFNLLCTSIKGAWATHNLYVCQVGLLIIVIDMDEEVLLNLLFNLT